MHPKSGIDADITGDITADTVALIDTTAYIIADTAPFIDTTASAEFTVVGDVRSGDRGTEA